MQRDVVEIFRSFTDRFIDQELIYISAEPMCISDFVARARCHEQFILMAGLIFPRLTEFMMKEAEAAFKSAGNIRIGFLPGAPFRERTNPRQVPTAEQLFENKICQRRRR